MHSDPLVALEHDVAKYIVRTARNLAEGPVPVPLRAMLVRDLYGREGEPGPAERFGGSSFALDAQRRDECESDFLRLATLEVLVREGDEAATQEALTLARAIARRIHEARSEQP